MSDNFVEDELEKTFARVERERHGKRDLLAPTIDGQKQLGNINLAMRKTFIGGIQGSGKTYLAKYLVKNHFRRGIMVRMTPDFDDVKNLDIVQPLGPGRAAQKESLERIARLLHADGKEYMENRRPSTAFDVLVIDEADIFIPSNGGISDYLYDLFQMHRHYNLAILIITRRPQDTSAIGVESCEHYFFFKMEGVNALKRMREIDPRIPELMKSVSKPRHNFIYKNLGLPPVLSAPVKE